VTETTSILPLTETATPADEAAAAEVVEAAYRAGTPVYPIGGGTGLGYGARPATPGLGLSLAGMTEVIDYPSRDLTITAQAGITIEALAARLATQGQRLPVDIPQAARATLGGAVACSPSGARRYGWGTMRDYVIGLSAVDGRGRPFSGGGRVVKNAAGYNLCRLMTGSLGTLGVITQVTLMVKPQPEASALVACEVPDLDMAERLLAGMVRTETLPAAIELLTGPAWQDLGTHEQKKGISPICAKHPPGRSAANWTYPLFLLVGLEGTAAEVEWQIRQLHKEWQAAGVASPVTISGPQAAALWHRLTEFPAEAGEPGAATPLVVRVGVLPDAVVTIVGRLLEMDPSCSMQAHAGDGVIVARPSWEPGAMGTGLKRRLRPAVTGAAGHLVVMSCPAEANLARESVWGPAGDGAAVMRAIKEQFDPKNILNPGRFVYP